MIDRRGFWLGCVIELALLAIAWVMAYAFKQPLSGMIGGSAAAIFWGIAATVPMLASFWWMLKNPSPHWASIRRFLEHVVRPVFGAWSVAQLATISILAGICEEALFRGVIQAGLAPLIGPGAAIVVASAAFGLAHPINRAYVVAATLIGLYLGALFWFTGDLVAPMIAHALYDFCALIYFLRLHRGDPR